MMLDDPSASAGKRFASDLQRIRLARDVSLDTIHRATRIAHTLLASFEETALLDHPAFNRVYLRSLVRAYAESIDIDVEAALDALDAAREGTYSGALADVYLDDASPKQPGRSSDDRSGTRPGGEDDDSTSSSPTGRASSLSFVEGGTDVPRTSRTRSRNPSDSSPSFQERAGDPSRTVSKESTPDPTEDSADDPSADASDPGEPPPNAEQAGDESARPPDADPEVPEEATDGDNAEVETEASPASGSGKMAAAPEPDTNDTDPEPDSRSSAARASEPVSPDPDAERAVSQPSASEDADASSGSPAPARSARERPSSSRQDAPADASPRSSASASASRTSFSGGTQLTWEYKAIIGGFVGAVLLIVAIIAFFLLRDPAPPAAPGAPSPAPPETTAVAEPAPPARPPANLSLGDTLALTVVAEGDVLGVRIQRDGDLRRPYWIEAGEASVFPFRQRIAIEERLDSVRLVLEGYPYPISPTAERVVISRDTVEAFADTLRGTPVALPAVRDTVALSPPS